VHNEQSLIAAFVIRSKRERYREMLSDPRLRHKFIHQLAHFRDFDPKYRLPIPSNKLFAENIAFELKKRKSPDIVFAISEDLSLDRRELSLVEALGEVVGRGMGTVLSCIPGHLIFVETEDERFILERDNPLEKREYIRFVVGPEGAQSDADRGIFHSITQALEWQNITGSDADELNGILSWFSLKLPKPSSAGRDKHRSGNCWFKTDAAEHINRIYEMVQILERNGMNVREIKTDKPGYVIYEDDWQLVAEAPRKGALARK